MSVRQRAWRRALSCAVLLLASAPLIGAAQVPPPVRDTLQIDTLRTDSVSTRRPLVQFPDFSVTRTAGFPAGEWVWDRDALLREGVASLVELLERIPAVAVFRAGMFVQPEVVSAFGLSAGRIEVELDGYVLDPLSASTLDLSQIPLAQLREVRVQRHLGLLRIRLRTDHAVANQPYTRVEAAVGVPAANLFRGLFLVPFAVVGPLAVGIERVDTDGTGGDEPASVFSGWGKWSWNNAQRGVQLEMIRTTLKREPRSPWPLERLRQDVVLRARNEFAPGLLAEAYVGRVSLEETVPRTADTLNIDRESVQAGFRAGYAASFGSVAGTFRYRNATQLPRTEAVLEAAAALGPLRAGLELGIASWHEQSTTYSSARALLGPFYGASAFAELTRGERGAPRWNDSSASFTDRNGFRAGLNLVLGGRASGSLALVRLEQDPALPFGLPFDSAAAGLTTAPARAVEAYGRLQIIPGWLAIESWIIDWQESAGWTYLPIRSWRTALELHAMPLRSGNLEILARGEGTQRSRMRAFDPTATEAEDRFPIVSSHLTFNGYLQIRVIDVRAFIRWDDVLGADIESLPHRVHNGPRIFYGVKWNLWN